MLRIGRRELRNIGQVWRGGVRGQGCFGSGVGDPFAKQQDRVLEDQGALRAGKLIGDFAEAEPRNSLGRFLANPLNCADSPWPGNERKVGHSPRRPRHRKVFVPVWVLGWTPGI